MNAVRQKPVALVVTVAALLAAGAVIALLATRPDPTAERATVLPSPLALPEFSLLDQHDAPFDRTSLEGRWSLMFFGFTHCPDICPLTLQKLATARRQLAARGSANLPSIVFVSVDPARDSSEVIGKYANAFGDGVTAVTGRLDQINTLTSALGIFHARPPKPDGGYDVEHSAAVLVVNPDAELKAVFSAPHDVASFVNDVTLIMDGL